MDQSLLGLFGHIELEGLERKLSSQEDELNILKSYSDNQRSLGFQERERRAESRSECTEYVRRGMESNDNAQ